MPKPSSASPNLLAVPQRVEQAVVEFRGALLRMQAKFALELSRDLYEAIEGSIEPPPQGMSTSEWHHWLLGEAIFHHDVDPPDAHSREAARQLLRTIGVSDPDGALACQDAGLQPLKALCSAPWHSVLTPLLEAVRRLAMVAAAQELESPHIRCADELAMVLQKRLRVRPDSADVLELVKPVEVLAEQMLRLAHTPAGAPGGDVTSPKHDFVIATLLVRKDIGYLRNTKAVKRFAQENDVPIEQKARRCLIEHKAFEAARRRFDSRTFQHLDSVRAAINHARVSRSKGATSLATSVRQPENPATALVIERRLLPST
ncbi:MAG: hypothetical protein WAT39_12860 [Planctomycetota bacterium]